MTNRLILVSPVFSGAWSLLKLSKIVDWEIKETYEQLFTIDLVSSFLWNWEEKILKSNLPKNLL